VQLDCPGDWWKNGRFMGNVLMERGKVHGRLRENARVFVGT
jgi:hypothetical protein